MNASIANAGPVRRHDRRRQVLVWGSGDIGSAVALALFRHGEAVAILEGPQPTTIRRRMAFSDAVFDGTAMLDDITAIRVSSLPDLAAMLAEHQHIPVVVGALDDLLRMISVEVLVDARMRKRAQPEAIRGLAPLTIGLGPGFTAGGTVDVAIETEWGDDLGRVLTAGATQPLRGEPRAIAGHARDRYVYAPTSGEFESLAAIGDQVRAGQHLARIGKVVLSAPLTGTLRGIARPGVAIEAGTKVIEVDPRLEGAHVAGVGERPARIASGVLEAIMTLPETTGALPVLDHRSEDPCSPGRR